MAKGLMRYGYSAPTDIKSRIMTFLDYFNKMYDHHDEGIAWKSPVDMLKQVGLYDITTQTFHEYLRDISNTKEGEPYGEFIDDIVGGVLKCNYAQRFDVNAFVGAVSTAPIAVGSDSAWKVKEGNSEIIKNCIERSKATVKLETTVDKIITKDNGTVSVVTADGTHYEFDKVIIATPLTEAKLTLNENVLEPEFEMQNLYVTFVHGRLNGQYFKTTQEYIETVDSVLVPESKSLGFNSIGKWVVDKDDTSYAVYKIFSMDKSADT
eukprot:UN31036